MTPEHNFDLDSLRSEILALIEPHTSSADTKPPFTVAQLVVISLAMTSHNDDPQSAEAAMMWIVNTFPYYSAMAYKQFCRTTGPHYEPLECIRDFHRAFWSAFDKSDVPLVEYVRLPCIEVCPKSCVHGNEAGSTLAAPRCRGEPLWSLDFLSARIFLGLHAHSGEDKPFRLLDLPTEIRERIFEFALDLPGRAVVIARDGRDVLRSFVFTRDLDYPVEVARWDLDFPPSRRIHPPAAGEWPRNYMLQGPSLAEHLAILRTNKKVCRGLSAG